MWADEALVQPVLPAHGTNTRVEDDDRGDVGQLGRVSRTKCELSHPPPLRIPATAIGRGSLDDVFVKNVERAFFFAQLELAHAIYERAPGREA